VQDLLSPPGSSLANSVVPPRLQAAVFDQRAINDELAAQGRLFNAKREEAGTDWAELERIDWQEIAAMDDVVSRITAGLTADNYVTSLEALL
jgi:hypothetical protein